MVSPRAGSYDFGRHVRRSVASPPCFDTRGYTEVPPSEAPGALGLMFPSDVEVNMLDSVIEEKSVPAIATFFSGIAACCGSEFTHTDRAFLDYPSAGDEERSDDDVLK